MWSSTIVTTTATWICFIRPFWQTHTIGKPTSIYGSMMALAALRAAWGIDMDSEGYGLTLGEIAFGDLNEDGWDDIVATRSDHKLVRVLGGLNLRLQQPYRRRRAK